MKRFFFWLIQAGFFLGALGVTAAAVAGALGFAFPLLDSLNHFQPFWFVTTLIVLLLAGKFFRGFRFRAFVTTLAATGFLASAIIVIPETIAGFLPHTPRPASDGPAYKLLTYNIFGRNYEMDRVAEMIRSEDPDIIVLQEYFSPQRNRLHPLLEGRYPYFQICTGNKRENVALYAKQPFDLGKDGACASDGSERTMRIVARFTPEEGVPFSVMTTHLDWPVQISQFRGGDTVFEGIARMTARQEGQFDDVAAAIAATEEPLIVAGDFNSTSWSYAVRLLVSGQEMVRHTRNLWTYPKQFYIGSAWRETPAILPLDQVMTRGGIQVHELHTGPASGSDHLPVIVRFTVAPQDLAV